MSFDTTGQFLPTNGKSNTYSVCTIRLPDASKHVLSLSKGERDLGGAVITKMTKPAACFSVNCPFVVTEKEYLMNAGPTAPGALQHNKFISGSTKNEEQNSCVRWGPWSSRDGG
jgi:hypothetical protein